jgi:hypothetical protein
MSILHGHTGRVTLDSCQLYPHRPLFLADTQTHTQTHTLTNVSISKIAQSLPPPPLFHHRPRKNLHRAKQQRPQNSNQCAPNFTEHRLRHPKGAAVPQHTVARHSTQQNAAVRPPAATRSPSQPVKAHRNPPQPAASRRWPLWPTAGN